MLPYRYSVEDLLNQPPERTGQEYHIVEFPPATLWNHEFWEQAIQSDGLWLKAWSPDGRIHTGNAISRMLPVVPRGHDDEKWLAELMSSVPSAAPELSKKTVPQIPLPSLHNRWRVQQELLDAEKRLAPGSLRDLVTFTRLQRGIYERVPEPVRWKRAEALLNWLNTQHEVAQRCLALHVRTQFPEWRDDLLYQRLEQIIDQGLANPEPTTNYRFSPEDLQRSPGRDP